ncbi:MAG: hypothetical protein U9O87_09730 [Verrucomicrobiota bacterium]|nr:hypothetical protein [Verrucomicrobiota bacterium]
MMFYLPFALSMNSIFEFIVKMLSMTAYQIISVLGAVLVFGFILYKLEKMTTARIVDAIGWNGILFTGWLGTPIHESGHVIFCWIFTHKIHTVKFFKPDQITGTLGYVEHSYNKRNLYQQIGNLFIGLGPLVTGCATLYLLAFLLLPDSKQLLSVLADSGITATISLTDMFKLLFESFMSVFTTIFQKNNLGIWQFWLFLYLSLCVTTHMAPSTADLKSATKGFITLFLMFLVFNIIFSIIGADFSVYTSIMAGYIGNAIGFILLGIIFSIINFAFAVVLNLIF